MQAKNKIARRNQTKTLLGIETVDRNLLSDSPLRRAAIKLKPY